MAEQMQDWARYRAQLGKAPAGVVRVSPDVYPARAVDAFDSLTA